MSKKNALLIVNPVAGRKKAQKLLSKVVDSLSKNGYKTTVFTTAKKGEAVEMILEHADEVQRVICCGGDGTISEVFLGLVTENLQIPVGYIPTGTTNDLAGSLNLPKNSAKAIETAVNGRIIDYDIGSFNKHMCFSYLASFGAFTKVAYSTPQWLKNMIGRTAYFFHGILSIADIRSHTVTVIADGEEISGDFVYGSVSNTTVIAGLINLPKEDIVFDDGEFEVMLIRTPKNPKELRSVVRGLFRQRYDERYVLYFKASHLSFTFENSTAWTIDGEYAGSLENVDIKNIHNMAQVVVPIHRV